MAAVAVRAMSMATLMVTPTATSMTMVGAEIEAGAAAEKLVTKAGGIYKAVAKRHRQKSTKKGNRNGNGEGDGNRNGDNGRQKQ
jgi:hypothetical protein